jgi:NADH-quinone oxidoreductase subunit A
MIGITENYLPILILLSISIIISIVMYLGSYIMALQKGDGEKISPYECGFNPFDDAREKFQVKFYLVAILFLIFDLEVSFLFP